VLVLSVTTNNATGDFRAVLYNRLENLGWRKVGGEGNYRGLRGTFAKLVDVAREEFINFIASEAERAKDVNLVLMDCRNVVVDDENSRPEIHLIITEALLYAEFAQEIVRLFAELPAEWIA
jgi:hypothetical protein